MSRASSPSSGRRYGTARVCQLWEVPRSTVYARAGASQPARAACGEARSERRRDGRRPHRADPRRARPLAVHRRGLPQGLGAAAPGRRAHLEGPGATADAAGGAARPDPRRAPPWASEPRRHDHHRPPRRAVGNRRHRLPHHPRGQTPRSSSPSTTALRSASASTRLAPARASRRSSRSARGCGRTTAATGRASPPGSACATTTAASTSADHFQGELRFLGIRPSPSFVAAPEGNGCAERCISTLKGAAALGGAVRDGPAAAPRAARVQGPLQPEVAGRAPRPPHPGRRPPGALAQHRSGCMITASQVSKKPGAVQSHALDGSGSRRF